MKRLFFVLLVCSSFSVYAAQTDSRSVQLFSNPLVPETFNLTFDCAAVQRCAGVVSSRNLYVPCMDERGALWNFSPGTFGAQRYAMMFCQTTPGFGSWVLRSDTLSYFVRSELDRSLYVLCMVKNGLACPLMDEAAQCPVLQLTDDGKINSFKIFNFAGTSDPMLQQAEAFAQVNTTLHRRFCEQWNKLPEGASNTIFAHEDPWSLLVHGELPQMVDRLQLLLLPHAVQQKYAHFLKNWHDEVYCQMPNVCKPQRLILPEKFLKDYTAYTLQMVAPDLAPGPLYNFSYMLGAVPPLITLVPCIPVPMVALVPCVPVVCAVPFASVQEVETKQESVGGAQSQTTRSITSKTGKRRAARKRSSSKAQAHIQKRMHEQAKGSDAVPVVIPETLQSSRPTEEESIQTQAVRVEQIVAQFNPDLFVHLPGDHVINFTESEETVCAGEQKSKFAQREEKLQQQLAQAQANLQERMKELQRKRIAALIARNKARQEKLRNEIEALKTARKLHSEDLAQWNETLVEEEKIIARADDEGKVLLEKYCKSLVQDIQAVVTASVNTEYDKGRGLPDGIIPAIHRIAEKLRFFEKYQGLYQRQDMVVDNFVFEAKSVDEGFYIASNFGNWCNAWFGKETVSSWVSADAVPLARDVTKRLLNGAIERKRCRLVLDRVAHVVKSNQAQAPDQKASQEVDTIDNWLTKSTRRRSTTTKLEGLLTEFVFTVQKDCLRFLHTLDDELSDQVEQDIACIAKDSAIAQVFPRLFNFNLSEKWSPTKRLESTDLHSVYASIEALACVRCCALSSSEQKRRYLRDDFFQELLADVCSGHYATYSVEEKIEKITQVCAAVYVMRKNVLQVPSEMYIDAVALFARANNRKQTFSDQDLLGMSINQFLLDLNSDKSARTIAAYDLEACEALLNGAQVKSEARPNFGLLLIQVIAHLAHAQKDSGDGTLYRQALRVNRLCFLAKQNPAFLGERCRANPDIEFLLQPVLTEWQGHVLKYRQQQEQGVFFPVVYVWLYHWREAFRLFGIPDEPCFALFKPSVNITKAWDQCVDVLKMHAAKK